MPVPPQGWSIENNDKFPALAQLVQAKASVLDAL